MRLANLGELTRDRTHPLPSFQWPIVAMLILEGFPVGDMDVPSGVGLGFVNVPVITPVTQVHSSVPNLMGCAIIFVSGTKTN